jgi:hypothetical protein
MVVPEQTFDALKWQAEVGRRRKLGIGSGSLGLKAHDPSQCGQQATVE